MHRPLILMLTLSFAAPAHADTSANAPPPAPPTALRAFMSRVRTAASARDVHALARLVDREFTTGQELTRGQSLGELRANPALLDDLTAIIDAAHCDIEPNRAQCAARIPGTPPERRALAIFLRLPGGGWRLGVFLPASD
jgi:hypothetical protein